jgi:hypothetical protein
MPPLPFLSGFVKGGATIGNAGTTGYPANWQGLRPQRLWKAGTAAGNEAQPADSE